MSTRPSLDRRRTLKWILSASACLAVPESLRAAIAASEQTASKGAAVAGYGTDPDLLRVYRPGELWPLTLTTAQRQSAAALCDVIIPADDRSPSASAVGVVDFIDEWISAPYADPAADRGLILDGLANLERQALQDFQKPFVELSAQEYRTLCDPICYLPSASAERSEAARFFARFRDLTAGAFYTSAEGTRDVGYIGNVALSRFEGPPLEVLRRAGLA